VPKGAHVTFFPVYGLKKLDAKVELQAFIQIRQFCYMGILEIFT
jgi:hypothetical protein